MRKIIIEVQIDWDDYDDVCDELMIEDAITIEKIGVTWKVLPQSNVSRSSCGCVIGMNEKGFVEMCDKCVRHFG